MDDVILTPGETIDGKYEIISMLGQGAMGVVYRARALALNRDVAIKLLTHGDSDTVSRFSAEAQSLARVKHPTVVRVDNFGSSEKWGPYLVLSYIPGRDLDAVAAAGLRVEEAVSLVIELCTGVFACHTRSVIHRNLKPSNVLVTNETIWLKRVKILDLGLALPFDSPILKARHTRTGQPGAAEQVSRYIAPELLRRDRPTARCDQYGIAALLYLLVTGRAPFSELEGEDLVRAIVLGSLLPPRHFRADIPADLEAILAKGFHPDPLQRFQNVKELALALVPFGPDNLKNKTTRYFMDMEGAIDLRLIEPVSAHRRGGGREMLPPSPGRAVRTAPLADLRLPEPAELPRDQVILEPSPAPRFVDPPPLPRFRKPSPAVLPVTSDEASEQRASRRSPWTQSNSVVLFVLGSALGAVIVTAVFVAFLVYRGRHTPPCSPCLNPPAETAPPPGGHAAH